MAAHCSSKLWQLVQGHILILFHLRHDQLLITGKSYLFTMGKTINPSIMNNLEFAFTMNTNGSNSLDAWASDTGRPGQQFRTKWCPCAIMSNLHWRAVAVFAWASDTGQLPALQIQESEVMQVASLCDTVEPALAGSGSFFQDDALELQLESSSNSG